MVRTTKRLTNTEVEKTNQKIKTLHYQTDKGFIC